LILKSTFVKTKFKVISAVFETFKQICKKKFIIILKKSILWKWLRFAFTSIFMWTLFIFWKKHNNRCTLLNILMYFTVQKQKCILPRGCSVYTCKHCTHSHTVHIYWDREKRGESSKAWIRDFMWIKISFFVLKLLSILIFIAKTCHDKVTCRNFVIFNKFTFFKHLERVHAFC
jgi:hypothetical protein